MNLLSIIGTRPQYIKIKPIFDYCSKNSINHKIIDTRQHYSYNVSDALIGDLSLKIDHSLLVKNNNEIEFVSKCIKNLGDLIKKESPSYVLVYGDTNSTFCAALAAYKLGVKVAHIEAGERCFDMSVPEEVNRVFVDGVSEFNFCSSEQSVLNLKNGIHCGDLEYEFLNHINPSISFENFGVMTIHRNENTSKNRLHKILSFCATLPYEIRLFSHHRTKALLTDGVPDNIKIYDACAYSEMVNNLSRCRFIITDSGSIQKTSAFFGKRTLIMRSNSEWKRVEKNGFAKLSSDNTSDDYSWILSDPPNRDRSFYLASGCRMPSEIILSTMLKNSF